MRGFFRVLLAAIFVAVGVVHLALPGAFLPIVPGWVPWPRWVVLGTGACEVAGGFALLTERWRRLAGVMLALYAVCVYPANIKHAITNVPPFPWWYHAPRLAFQPVIVWWSLYSSRVTNWPFQ